MKKLILIPALIICIGQTIADPPTKTVNSTAKAVNAYLGKKKEPLIEFHTPQARVKFIVLTGIFVTGLVLFFKGMPK
jgi:hypothetical protein